MGRHNFLIGDNAMVLPIHLQVQQERGRVVRVDPR